MHTCGKRGLFVSGVFRMFVPVGFDHRMAMLYTRGWRQRELFLKRKQGESKGSSLEPSAASVICLLKDTRLSFNSKIGY